MGYARTLFLAAVLLLTGASAVLAIERPSTDKPLLLMADELVHDRELGTVTARGKVEIALEERLLLADTVTYNEREHVLTASGNVSLLEPSGDVLFGEFMEISGDFKDGIVRDLRVLLSDSARLAAAGGRLSGGKRLEMRNAVYSPCNTCLGKSGLPLWRVKAIKVVHDQDAKTVEYTDAWLEFLGVPVAYTPYLSHPDPTVKRQSGFLVPRFGASNNLGMAISTPYYWVIAPNKDLTITPTFTTEERVVLAGDYREVTRKGEWNAAASVNYDSKNDFRGHVRSRGRFNGNETWRWGYDLDRTSDDTYTRRFGFGGGDTLTSKLFAEGFRRRNYISASTLAFQGLREEDDRGDTPYVFPLLEYAHVSEAGRLGAKTNLDASFMALTRTGGTDTKRMSLGAAWSIPYASPIGDLYDLSLSLRGDLYHVNSLDRGVGVKDFSGLSGRVHPQLAFNWRFPLSRQENNVSHVIEPIVSLVVSPYGGNPTDIPNEDSSDLEFDDTNLFSTNRFTGLDRVEGGPRVSYGLKWSGTGAKGGNASFFLGQSYRAKADDTFNEGSGLEDNFSDIVGRLKISPGQLIDFTYRTRIDKNDFSPRRNEVRLRAGPPALRLASNYVFFDRQKNSEFSGREEIQTGVATQLNRFWRGNFNSRYDLEENGGLRSIGLRLTYECDCFQFSAAITRTFYEDRDVKPSDAILFRLTFKTLGNVQTGFSRTGGP